MIFKNFTTPRFNNILFYFLCACCLILFTGCGVNSGYSQPKMHSHYEIDASINPETGLIEANVRMQLIPDEPVDTLRFLLHSDLLPVNISGYESGEFTVKTFQNLTYIKEIIIPVTYSPKEDNSVSLEWSYSGSVDNKHLQSFRDNT